LTALAAGVANYVYALVLTHGLSPRSYTIFAGAQSLVVIVGIIGSAGVPLVLAKEVAGSADADRHGHAVGFALTANALLGIVAAVIVGVVATIFASPAAALVVGGTTLTLAIGSTGLGLLQGTNKMLAIAGIFALEVVLKLAVGLFLVFAAHRGAIGALLGGLAGAAALLLSLPSLRRARPVDVAAMLRAGLDRALWQETGRIALLQIGVGMMAAVDTLMIAALTSTRHVGGSYQVASALGKVPLFLAGAISTAVFPALVAGDRIARRVDALQSYTLVSLFSLGFLTTVPGRIIRLLFNSDYSSVSHWLPYAAALGVGLGALNLLTTFLQAENRARLGTVIVIAATALMIAAAGIGGAVDGIRGLVVGANIVTWAAVLAVAALPGERVAIAAFAARLAGRRLLVGYGSMLLLVLSRPLPWVWVVVAAVAGSLIVGLAFPDVPAALRRNRRAGRPPA
jgi:O-antigen/teichoic acid export membrane protein